MDSLEYVSIPNLLSDDLYRSISLLEKEKDLRIQRHNIIIEDPDYDDTIKAYNLAIAALSIKLNSINTTSEDGKYNG